MDNKMGSANINVAQSKLAGRKSTTNIGLLNLEYEPELEELRAAAPRFNNEHG